MKNKVLINIYVVSLDETYEIYIPVNESVNKILESTIKLVIEFSDSSFVDNAEHFFVDPDTMQIYNEANLVRDTNIRNGKLLLLV